MTKQWERIKVLEASLAATAEAAATHLKTAMDRQAEIERLREIVWNYVDPFDVDPEDQEFVMPTLKAVWDKKNNKEIRR